MGVSNFSAARVRGAVKLLKARAVPLASNQVGGESCGCAAGSRTVRAAGVGEAYGGERAVKRGQVASVGMAGTTAHSI